MSRIETNIEKSKIKSPSDTHPIDINTGLLKHHRILLQETQTASIFIGLGRREALVQEITKAEKLFKEYNNDENRDQNGRWTSGSGRAVSVAATATANEGIISVGLAGARTAVLNNLPTIGSIFGRLSLLASEALTGFAATFAAPAAFLGAYFIPLGRSSVASGPLPGHPGLSYHYDGDEGHFSLYNSDKELLFTGTAGGDGLIRTIDGDVIGRRVDGSVVLDSNVIPDESASEADSSAETQAQAATATSQPNLCPEPLPDRPGFKSTRSMLYQQYISTIVNPEHPMPFGLAVYFTDPITGKTVAFDDCYHDVGDPTEAKGPGIARMVQNEKMARFLGMSFTKQAERQVDAAPGHRIDWYVDEPGAAEFFRKTFSTPKLANINVIDAPMTFGKLFLS
jgi:hypothetical protein